jgi:hypothetical protein
MTAGSCGVTGPACTMNRPVSVIRGRTCLVAADHGAKPVSVIGREGSIGGFHGRREPCDKLSRDVFRVVVHLVDPPPLHRRDERDSHE